MRHVAREQFFDVFAHDIDFDIDEVPGGCEARCEYCLGMRDEHDVEIGLPDAVDGERYTVDGYRTFFDDIANVVARNCESELFP